MPSDKEGRFLEVLGGAQRYIFSNVSQTMAIEAIPGSINTSLDAVEKDMEDLHRFHHDITHDYRLTHTEDAHLLDGITIDIQKKITPPTSSITLKLGNNTLFNVSYNKNTGNVTFLPTQAFAVPFADFSEACEWLTAWVRYSRSL